MKRTKTIIKKNKKQTKTGKTQKQKQKQSVNVNVHIDQSKRSQLRKPKSEKNIEFTNFNAIRTKLFKYATSSYLSTTDKYSIWITTSNESIKLIK